MKTSNRILTIYGVAFGAFCLASLGLNAARYAAVKDELQLSADALGAPVRVVVVERGQTVNWVDDRDPLMYVQAPEIVTARVSGDTLTIDGRIKNLVLPHGPVVVER